MKYKTLMGIVLVILSIELIYTTIIIFENWGFNYLNFSSNQDIDTFMRYFLLTTLPFLILSFFKSK